MNQLRGSLINTYEERKIHRNNSKWEVYRYELDI